MDPGRAVAGRRRAVVATRRKKRVGLSVRHFTDVFQQDVEFISLHRSSSSARARRACRSGRTPPSYPTFVSRHETYTPKAARPRYNEATRRRAGVTVSPRGGPWLSWKPGSRPTPPRGGSG